MSSVGVSLGSSVVDGVPVSAGVPELSVALGCRNTFVHRRPWWKMIEGFVDMSSRQTLCYIEACLH